MANTTDNISVADLLGPWADPDWDSGLIDRCRTAWGKPLRDLTNQEMATLLRQRVAVEHILPLARKRVEGVLTTIPRFMTESVRLPSSTPATPFNHRAVVAIHAHRGPGR